MGVVKRRQKARVIKRGGMGMGRSREEDEEERR